jgi:Kdo2-lipid IVA lauroyltransferase/acyltransferase
VRSLLDLLRLPCNVSELSSHVRFDRLDNFEAARAKGQGVLCATGHFGSFELVAGAIAQRLEVPVWLVVKPFPAGFDRFLSRVRRATGLGLLPARGSLKEIFAALGRGEAVVFVIDQNATRKLGVFVDFFGHPACTMNALAVVAKRSGAPVIGASIWREGEGHVLEVHPEMPLEEGADLTETIRKSTQRFTRFIEDQIRRHPEQWLWTHKRWRTKEGGASGSRSRST